MNEKNLTEKLLDEITGCMRAFHHTEYEAKELVLADPSPGKSTNIAVVVEGIVDADQCSILAKSGLISFCTFKALIDGAGSTTVLIFRGTPGTRTRKPPKEDQEDPPKSPTKTPKK